MVHLLIHPRKTGSILFRDKIFLRIIGKCRVGLLKVLDTP
jgi:hypothetical protein